MAEFFNNNVKHLRISKGMSQQQLADKIGVDRSTISRIENDETTTSIDDAINIADALEVSLDKLLGVDLRFDNAEFIDIFSDVVTIPVLGTIKAGTPIEAQEDILEYVNIPKEWTNGDKKFFGLKISGDSMYPEYKENDIVIFEEVSDYSNANRKNCAVMVNGNDATFKHVSITENGISLIPLNINNSDNYQPTFYNREEVQNKPVKIIGVAKEKRTRLN